MRRLFLPLALVALTGTLVAQVPAQVPQGISQVPPGEIDRSHFKSATFMDSVTAFDANTSLWNGVRFEFTNGVTVSADEAIVRRGEYTAELRGNVKLIVRH